MEVANQEINLRIAMSLMAGSVMSSSGLEVLYLPHSGYTGGVILVMFLAKFLFLDRLAKQFPSLKPFRVSALATLVNLVVGLLIIPFLPLSVDSGSGMEILSYYLLHLFLLSGVETVVIWWFPRVLDRPKPPPGLLFEKIAFANFVAYSVSFLLLAWRMFQDLLG